MNQKILRLAAAGLLGMTLCGSSLPAYAAPAWTLPSEGVQMENTAKQAYIYKEMYGRFHPAASSAKPAVFEAPDGWTYTRYSQDGLVLEELTNPEGSGNRTILQLHGGGYIGPLHNGYRNQGVRQAVLSNARDTYMVNYRLAPRHTYPAALDDAMTAYRFMLKKGYKPENIIVFGDSAGGNLALALSAKLKEEKLPQPALLILDSPWTTLETESPSRKESVKRDLVLGEINPGMFHEINHPTYAKGMNLSDPHLSPVYGDLTGFPPMLIQAGGYELFLDDGMKLAKKAAADNVKVTLTVYPGMSHDFALCLPELQDSIASFAEIRDFINLNMKP
ncbi:alpha/beta hydrolase [Dialister hominis]|jgi:monoterpene epsilon-lactone hydrolase|uniref:alpha/beta hydrolase n=2 Tax=Dialister TaxID=39948 RepID=UPI003AF017D4